MKQMPYWWEELPAFQDQPDEFVSEADVVVVGAGLTGCSAALTLARAGKSVVVLEAERPGHGASTRNGGMIGGGYRLSTEEMTGKYGRETALALLEESYITSHEFAVKRIRDEGMQCDYVRHGRFRGLWTPAEYDSTARALDDLRRQLPVDIDMVPPERQRDEIASDLYCGGVLFNDHGGLHPGKYLAEMLRVAVRAGALVYGETPVSAITPFGSGYQVHSARGTLRADAVLMATNGYTTRDFPHLMRRLIPVSSYLIATEELPEGLARELMPGGRMYVETRNRHCYFRLSPDGTRVVLGGRAAMHRTSTQRTAKILYGLLTEIFPKLKGIGLSYSWTGQTGFSFSFLPQIGRFDGVWFAVGYSGSGNAMAPYLGHKAALLMMGDSQGETAFTKTVLETRFWYRKVPWFLPAAHLIYRAKDCRDDLLRRRRHLRRRDER